MSVKSIDEFYLHLLNNDEAKSKFKQLKNRYAKENLTPENAIEFLEMGLIPFAQQLGYNFSVDDIIDYEAKNHTKQLRKEYQQLSDESLENISAGSNSAYNNYQNSALNFVNFMFSHF